MLPDRIPMSQGGVMRCRSHRQAEYQQGGRSRVHKRVNGPISSCSKSCSLEMDLEVNLWLPFHEEGLT